LGKLILRLRELILVEAFPDAAALGG